MKITTWNINGVKARLESAVADLKQENHDVVCFQEIISVVEGLPREAVEDLGYNVETLGQKCVNGVALLSKSRMEDVTRGLPWTITIRNRAGPKRSSRRPRPA